MSSPSGNQGRISQLIREERTVVDPDLDQNLQLLQLTSLYENVDLSENSPSRFRSDSEDNTSIDSSNPDSPSSPSFFKYRPSNICISQSQSSDLRTSMFHRSSFPLSRKRKSDVFFADDIDRISVIRSMSRSISPRSISPIGECRSAPQSPLCLSATWDPTGIRRPHSSKSTSHDRDSLSSSCHSSPYNSTECLIQPPRLNISVSYDNHEINEIENVQKLTPNSNETFVFPDKTQKEEQMPISSSFNQLQIFQSRRLSTGRMKLHKKCLKLRKSLTPDNSPLINNDEPAQTNVAKRRKIE